MTEEQPKPETIDLVAASIADLERQRGTAVSLLALFIAQIAAHDEHVALGRAARRAAIRRGEFDVTILTRIDGLRDGRATWSKRLADINAAIARATPGAWKPCTMCQGTGLSMYADPRYTNAPCPTCAGTGRETL